MNAASRMPIALGTAGLAVIVASGVPTLGERGGGITSYGGISPGAAVLEFVTGVALFVAATVLAADPRRRASASATFLLGLAWSSSAWIGSVAAPTALANVALLLAPLVAPAALLVVATLTTLRRTRLFGAAVAVIVAGWGVVLSLMRDPFLDRYCWRDCLVNAWAPFADVERARAATNISLALGVACGLVVFAISLLALRSRRDRALRWAFAPGIAVGAVLAASSAALLLEPAENPERQLFAALFVARALALVAFAAGLVVATAVRRHLVRRQIAALSSDTSTGSGAGLAASLARAFDGPELQVGYPLADGTVVDADGRPITLADTAIQIVRGGQLVALVATPAGVHSKSLARELGPAGRLSLANERLRAEQLARLRELTELRRRIVSTGDAARRRLERDLHDGAQQRLLALVFDLRVAIARAESAEREDTATLLRSALEHMAAAVTELREVAHGLFPTVLTTSGLVAAVESLADSRPLTLTLGVDARRRFPPDVETAAYAVVSESTEGASASVRVEIAEDGGELRVAIDDAPWNGGVVSVEDRIGALGGTVERVGQSVVATLPLGNG
jgi:signal transduction histidine kinase